MGPGVSRIEFQRSDDFVFGVVEALGSRQRGA